jgi:prophage regulatory protein
VSSRTTVIAIKPVFLDKPSIAEFVCLSVDTLERLVQKGAFPAARQISDKRVGWLVREVEEWAESRPISSNLPVANCGKRGGSHV